MDIKKPVIGICTPKEKIEDTLIYNSIIKYKDTFKDIIIKTSNTESLQKMYNNIIEESLDLDADCLILVHDDVILEENPIPKLEKLFNDYALVGVAGTSKIELKRPALWHLMGGGWNGGRLHGKVNHLAPNGDKFPTEFGKYPNRAVMIDGVFMALNRNVMMNVRFDEKCPSGFHFYDLIFSLDCHNAWYKVGVGDILITHQSPGLREYTQDWKDGQEYFLNKYDN